MSILYIYAESVQCLSKPKEDLKLQDCEWPDLGVGSCPQRSKEGIGPAGIGISDGSEPPCGGWESNPGALKYTRRASKIFFISVLELLKFSG